MLAEGWTQTAKYVRRLWRTLSYGKDASEHAGQVKLSERPLPAGSTTPTKQQEPSPAARSQPAGTNVQDKRKRSPYRLVKPRKEEPQRPGLDARGRGNTRQAHRCCPKRSASLWLFLSRGFPEPSFVSFISLQWGSSNSLSSLPLRLLTSSTLHQPAAKVSYPGSGRV